MIDSLKDIFTREKIPFSKLNDFSHISSRQRQHLKHVFSLLAASVLLTSGGIYFNANVLALPSFIPMIAQIACLFYITSTRLQSQSSLKNTYYTKRIGAFGGLAFFTGALLSPFLHYVHFVHPSIIQTAFCATLAVFTCFFIAALVAKDRKYLYLGGILSSAMGYMMMVNFFNLFFRSKLAHDVVLYGGFLSYMGFVLYDTQVILYESQMGHEDAIMHALSFYSDIIGIFIRLVIILLRREEDDHGRRKRQR